MLICNRFGRRLDWYAVHGQQHVAALDAGSLRRRPRRDFERRDALVPNAPENAVLHFVPARVQRDVGQAEADEDRDDGSGKQRTPPHEPAALSGS